MARAATTTDVFNAIAEPKRRQIVGLLADGRRRAVGELVDCLALPQPVVSKHLQVLRAVGVVTPEKCGQQRLYRLNPEELKPVYDWVKNYEKFWDRQLHRLKMVAEEKSAKRREKKDG